MKTVGIYLGGYMQHIPGDHKWDENDVLNGMGGSETWAYEVGLRLSKMGYDVTVYAEPWFDHDVCENFHLVTYNRYWYDILHREYDYFLFSRYGGPSIITPYLKCHNVYLVVHDICVITPNDFQSQISLSRVKKYCYLSDWHKHYLLDLYSQQGLRENQLYKISNGYSSQFYEDINISEKTNSMVWSSSLSRGFNDFYEYVFFPLLKKIPDLKLYVCTGTIAPLDKQQMERANLMPGVKVLNKLSKEDLAKYQRQAKIWIYPGQFPETFCITAVENAMAGNVIVSPLSYGLSTTLDNLQYLKDWNLEILNEENSQIYIDKAYEILTMDNDKFAELSEMSRQSCKDFSWDRAANEIHNLFQHNITESELYNYNNSLL